MLIAGVDEVGRGPLAGPVVAGAVILAKPIDGIKDSKLLSSKKREILASQIKETAIAYALGVVDSETIDKINIHHATLLAMKKAIDNLKIKPDYILVDGKFTPITDIKCKAIIKGDESDINIGAASIVAKVWRDEEMIRWHNIFPQYGFNKHKGYATKAHFEALRTYGCCKIHRLSFALGDI